MKKYLGKISFSELKINGGNPVKMELFLSFLTVDVERSRDHLGYITGWTQLNGENRLVIGGGVVNGVEYLDSIQYGNRLDNQYNNYVNPLYLFDIMTEEGKKFFLKYYQDDIKDMIEEKKRRYKIALKEKNEMVAFWKEFKAKAKK